MNFFPHTKKAWMSLAERSSIIAAEQLQVTDILIILNNIKFMNL